MIIMLKIGRHYLIKLASLFLIFTLLLPCSVSAAVVDPVQPMASNYLDSYNTYICNMGSGEIQIWFEVMADTDMDELGTLSIILYESTDNVSWSRVKTFLHEDYSSMLAEDDFFHCSYVSYQGVAGRYYKAYVCIWAGKNGSGDTRYMWATMV